MCALQVAGVVEGGAHTIGVATGQVDVDLLNLETEARRAGDQTQDVQPRQGAVDLEQAAAEIDVLDHGQIAGDHTVR